MNKDTYPQILIPKLVVVVIILHHDEINSKTYLFIYLFIYLVRLRLYHHVLLLDSASSGTGPKRKVKI